MSPDVEHLLETLRAPGFGYRESGTHPSARTAPAVAPATAGERTIVVASPLGGAGRTTVASALADAIATGGWSTLALDLDPADELRRRLDRSPLDAARESTLRAPTPGANGRAPALGASGRSPQAAERRDGGPAARAACVRYGAPSAYLSALAAEPDALVVDTPAGISAALEDALAPADEVVVLLRADAASRGAIAPFDAVLARARLRSARRFRARYVVNAFDGRRAPARAELAAIRELLGERLWPRPLQWDPDVARAPRDGRPIAEIAPASQLALELGLLAQDLMAASGPAGARAG